MPRSTPPSTRRGTRACMADFAAAPPRSTGRGKTNNPPATLPAPWGGSHITYPPQGGLPFRDTPPGSGGHPGGPPGWLPRLGSAQRIASVRALGTGGVSPRTGGGAAAPGPTIAGGKGDLTWRARRLAKAACRLLSICPTIAGGKGGASTSAGAKRGKSTSANVSGTSAWVPPRLLGTIYLWLLRQRCSATKVGHAMCPPERLIHNPRFNLHTLGMPAQPSSPRQGWVMPGHPRPA